MEKIFSSLSSTPYTKWSGSSETIHGTSIIIYYSYVGGQRDLGNKLGKYIQSDKRSWLLELAKFMRIRVDLPINKPLRRGANIVNLDGDKYWFTFKYERLPNFCFLCGILGHDEKHCSGYPSNPEALRQYGDWLRANGNPKSGLEKPRKLSSNGFEERKDEGLDDQQTPTTSNSIDTEAEQVGPLTTLPSHTHPKNLKLGQDGTSIMQPAENLAKSNKVRPLSPFLTSTHVILIRLEKRERR